MEKFFDESGQLTALARRMMLDLTSGLNQLMDYDEVAEMTENELRLLGTHLASLMANTISKKIARKLQRTKVFSEMDDVQFEEFLQEKYGSVWRLVPLTPEEYARCPNIKFEQVVTAIKGDHNDRKIDPFGPYVSDSNDE